MTSGPHSSAGGRAGEIRTAREVFVVGNFTTLVLLNALVHFTSESLAIRKLERPRHILHVTSST